jgi:predicted DNA-binding antitoxin AbrB/MazE fold protein
MSHVEAVFRHGVFEPLEPVRLAEEQRVRLSIEPAGAQTPQSWLSAVQKLQAGVIERQGPLPAITADIAADRLR